MDKINFRNNLPPYLSADNLNQIQDNVEKAIQPMVIQKKINNATIAEQGYLYFGIDDFKNGDIDSLVEFKTNGLIEFKHNAKVRITINLWVGSENKTARPWVKLRDYTNNKDLAYAINDNSSGFATLEISNYCMEVANGKQLGVNLTALGSVTVNSASGGQNSYINIEVLEVLPEEVV